MEDPQNGDVEVIQVERLKVVDALAENVASEIGNILSALELERHLGDSVEGLHGHIERFEILRRRLLSYVQPRSLARQAFSLNDTVRSCAGLLSRQIKLSNVELVLDLDQTLPDVVADLTRIEYMIVNILQNALQSVSTSGGKLNVRTYQTTSHCILRVEDNGRGMSAETIAQAFEPFYSTRQDGVGIGLFSCRRICDEHGWAINISSEPEAGSTILIEIPLELAES